MEPENNVEENNVEENNTTTDTTDNTNNTPTTSNDDTDNNAVFSQSDVDNKVKEVADIAARRAKGDIAALFGIDPTKLEDAASSYKTNIERVKELETKIEELETNLENKDIEYTLRERIKILRDNINNVANIDTLFTIADNESIDLMEVFNEEGELDKEALKEKLDTIKESHNYLFVGTNTPPNKSFNGANNKPPTTEDKKEMLRKQLMKKLL